MKTCIYITLFIICFVVCNCKKDNPSPNIFEGKLKQLITVDSATNTATKYNFYYNESTKELEDIYLNDTAFYKITKIDNKTITIDYVRFPGQILYAHLNDYGKIVSLNSDADTINSYQYPLFGQYSTSNQLNNLFINDCFLNVGGCPGPIYYVCSDIHCTDLQYLNNNCVQLKLKYLNSTVNPCSPIQDSTQIFMSYTSLDNTGNYVMQTPFSDLTSFQTELYFLGINGYFFGEPSQKLIQSKTYNLINNFNIQYEYTLNSSNQVTRVVIRNFLSAGNTVIMEYKYY